MVLIFASSPPTEIEIQGELRAFHPLSLRGILKVKGLAKPISQAFLTLFSNTNNDTPRQIERFYDENAKQTVDKTNLGAIDPALAKLRHDQQTAAIGVLTDALFDQNNIKMLVEVVADSMRDSSLNDKYLDLEITLIVELVKGTLKANMGVLGPLAPRVMQAMQAASPNETSPKSPASSLRAVRDEDEASENRTDL